MVDIIFYFIFLLFVALVVRKWNKNEAKRKFIDKYGLCQPAEIALIMALKRIGFEDKQIFFNLYVPNGENYTQIDVLVVCRIGIIVFEVKDYNSAIFGGIDEKYWHHTYISHDTYQMYNPIIQNANHISCLKKHFSGFNMLNVVVFFGNCRLRHTKFLSSKSCLIYAKDLFNCIKYLYYHNKQTNSKLKSEYLAKLKEFMQNAHNEEIVALHRVYVENKKYN